MMKSTEIQKILDQGKELAEKSKKLFIEAEIDFNVNYIIQVVPKSKDLGVFFDLASKMNFDCFYYNVGQVEQDFFDEKVDILTEKFPEEKHLLAELQSFAGELNKPSELWIAFYSKDSNTLYSLNFSSDLNDFLDTLDSTLASIEQDDDEIDIVDEALSEEREEELVLLLLNDIKFTSKKTKAERNSYAKRILLKQGEKLKGWEMNNISAEAWGRTLEK